MASFLPIDAEGLWDCFGFDFGLGPGVVLGHRLACLPLDMLLTYFCSGHALAVGSFSLPCHRAASDYFCSGHALAICLAIGLSSALLCLGCFDAL